MIYGVQVLGDTNLTNTRVGNGSLNLFFYQASSFNLFVLHIIRRYVTHIFLIENHEVFTTYI
jgi:hypothetical protein